MEGYLAPMIPILAMSIPFFAIWTKHQQKLAEMNVTTTAESTAERAAPSRGAGFRTGRPR